MDLENREGGSNYFTSTRAKVRGAIQFCEKMGIQNFKEDVFRTFGVSSRQGWEFLRNNASSRRRHNDPSKEETRGRKSVVSPEKIREMERIVETEGIEARAYKWEQLEYGVGLESSGRTIRKAMETMEYHKCMACRRGWVNEKTRKDRLEYATVMLQRYPNPQDWYRARFSGGVHFGYGPQDKLHIIRKPGMQYCHSFIQENPEPAEKDRKRYHCWAAIGLYLKSDVNFYKVTENTNSMMSQKAYINTILKPIVKPWIEVKQDFVVEEDGD